MEPKALPDTPFPCSRAYSIPIHKRSALVMASLHHPSFDSTAIRIVEGASPLGTRFNTLNSCLGETTIGCSPPSSSKTSRGAPSSTGHAAEAPSVIPCSKEGPSAVAFIADMAELASRRADTCLSACSMPVGHCLIPAVSLPVSIPLSSQHPSLQRQSQRQLRRPAPCCGQRRPRC